MWSKHDTSSSNVFLKIALSVWDLLCFHTHLRIFSTPMKNTTGISIGIASNLYIVKIIFMMLILLIHGQSIPCHLFCPHSSGGKESMCNAGDLGLIPHMGRPPGEGNGNPLQYSCLQNSMDIGAWWVTVHGITKSWTWLSD